MPAKSIQVKNLRAATEASIKAVLGKKFIGRPGILVGLWLDKVSIANLKLKPGAVAGDIAKQVSLMSGIKVRPSIRTRPGGVLVGYIQPQIFKR